MPCQHNHITLRIEYASQMLIISWSDIGGHPGQKIGPEQLAPDTAWRSAGLHVTCNDCAQQFLFGCDRYPFRADWFRAHWDRIVALGGLPAEIARYYGMAEQPTAAQDARAAAAA